MCTWRGWWEEGCGKLVGVSPEYHSLLPCLPQSHAPRGWWQEIRGIRKALQPFLHILCDKTLAYIIVSLVCLVVTSWLCGYPQKIVTETFLTALGKQSCIGKGNSRIALVSLLLLSWNLISTKMMLAASRKYPKSVGSLVLNLQNMSQLLVGRRKMLQESSV